MLLPSPEKEVVLDASSSLLPALTTQQPCAPCLLHRSPPWPGHWNSMQPMDWALPLVQHNHDSTRGENEASKMRLTVMPLQETLRWPPLAPRYLSIHEEGPRLFLTLAPLPYRFPLSLYSQCHIHSLTFSHMVFPSLLPSFFLSKCTSRLLLQPELAFFRCWACCYSPSRLWTGRFSGWPSLHPLQAWFEVCAVSTRCTAFLPLMSQLTACLPHDPETP